MPKNPSLPGVTATIAGSRAAGTLACVIVIAAAVLLAWSGSFTAPFVLDDHPSIVANASIRDFASLDWLSPPATAGETVSGRPVLNFTFAVNHALGGLAVEGYHVANVLIHVLAALALFGVVRRTLGRARPLGAPFNETAPLQDPSKGQMTHASETPALLFAVVVTLLWALHPLHTGAVTYVVQRAESLCGLFCLLTLYCFIRGSGSRAVLQPALGRASGRAEAPPYLGPLSAYRLWFATSVVACLLAVGTKETAAVAPLVVLLYDRAFLSGSFGAALRARWRVHAALAATWIPLAVLVLTNRGRGGSAGFGVEIDSWTYILTQAGAIVRYLALAFWPSGLVFDYGTPLVGSLAEVWWQAAAVVVLLAATSWAILRKPRSGFLAACFFLLLAPSSSFVPVATQTVAEHRMYLPLAALIVIVGLGVSALLRRFQSALGRAASSPLREPLDSARSSELVEGQRDETKSQREVLPITRRVTGATVAFATVLIIALGAVTFARNRVYRSELALWSDTVVNAPVNPRARNNLGLALSAAGRTDQAVAEFEQAIALQPNHAFAHFNLAVLHTKQEAWDAAVAHFRAAVEADPGYVSAHVNLGDVLARLGRTDEAIAHLESANAFDPAAHDARTALAALLIQKNRIAEAVAMLRSVLAAAPEFAEAHFHLGRALEKSNASASEIETAYRDAVRLKPEMAFAHLALGNMLAARGDLSGAERSLRDAVRLDARSAEARFALGNVFAATERFDAAMSEYRQALAIDPAHAGALNNLGNCQLVTGRFREAAATYEAVLRLRPDDETVKENLRLAREMERTRGPGGGD